jgi:hypothetical protein
LRNQRNIERRQTIDSYRNVFHESPSDIWFAPERRSATVRLADFGKGREGRARRESYLSTQNVQTATGDERELAYTESHVHIVRQATLFGASGGLMSADATVDEWAVPAADSPADRARHSAVTPQQLCWGSVITSVPEEVEVQRLQEALAAADQRDTESKPAAASWGAAAVAEAPREQ